MEDSHMKYSTQIKIFYDEIKMSLRSTSMNTSWKERALRQDPRKSSIQPQKCYSSNFTSSLIFSSFQNFLFFHRKIHYLPLKFHWSIKKSTALITLILADIQFGTTIQTRLVTPVCTTMKLSPNFAWGSALAGLRKHLLLYEQLL